MSVIVVTPPERLPVSVPEQKRWMRQDADYEDDEVAATLQASVAYCQKFTARQFLTATLELSYDAFPVDRGARTPGFRLPSAPTQSIEEITYLDVDGVPQMLDPALYQTDFNVAPALIRPARGESWPPTRDHELAAVTATWIAGYGPSAGDCPEELRVAIKQYATYLFDSREAECPVPMALKNTLRRYQVLGADVGGQGVRNWARAS